MTRTRPRFDRRSLLMLGAVGMLTSGSAFMTARADPISFFTESLPVKDFHTEDGALENPDLVTDVLVVGGGAAGLCAAVAAAEAGAKVLLLEKASALGGDTLISGGYYNAVDPARQRLQGITDSVEAFCAQMLAVSGGFSTPAVVHALASGAGETLSWLEAHGLAFLPRVMEVYGSMFPRAHKPILPRGTGWIRALSESALAAGVQIRTNAAVVRLMRDEASGGVSEALAVMRSGSGAVLHRVRARRGVMVASGGYGANPKLVAEASPDLAKLPVDSSPGSTGEMLEAARRVGADIVNLRFIECVPGSRAGMGFPIRLDYIPQRMIMVDHLGRRFVDETGSRAEVAEAILRAGSPAWAIADADAVRSFDAHEQKNLYRGLYAGEAYREQTPEALARVLGLDLDVFRDSMTSSVARERLRARPLWATGLHLRVHSTLGGIRIDEHARALSPLGEPVPGLWAAGAATGNVHGRTRIGANGLNCAAVFGRLAGLGAARIPSLVQRGD